MSPYIEVRVLEEANYIINTGATLRATAKVLGGSKSTVFKDMTERLKELNPALAWKVDEILAVNKAARHYRGGEATKTKYLLKG